MNTDFTFNIIIIPLIVIATALIGHGYVKRGDKTWYRQMNKPKWIPSGKLIQEIWTFIYIVIGLAVLWYWNVPIVSWLHYVVGGLLLISAYLNIVRNKVFLVERNLPKALKVMKTLIVLGILTTGLMAVTSPIAAAIFLPYIIWLVIITRLISQLIKLNQKH